MIQSEKVIEKLMVFFIGGGFFLALIVTAQHLTGKTHRSYDPWLLPIYVAMLLQIASYKK
jgi:hypothetical protein